MAIFGQILGFDSLYEIRFSSMVVHFEPVGTRVGWFGTEIASVSSTED